MAIQLQYQHPSFELLVWKITESIPFLVEQLGLSAVEFDDLKQRFKNSSSLLEWLASRYCLQVFFEKPYTYFKKNTSGKLELIDKSSKLSISHSNQQIAIVKSKSDIGVDIQISTPKLQRIASKYIDEDLLAHLKKTDNYVDYLHIYWGIKEALFKAYGLGKVDFIKHLHITAFSFEEEGETLATISKPNFKANYQVFYQKKEDYYLCIVTKI